jgi:hypothetical protein
MSGCDGRAESGDIPVLDLEAAIDNEKVLDITEIADKVEFIPLDDSTERSLIGTIWNMSESKNCFYVHEGGNPVKLFDRAGKFISTRGTFGRGPDEFLMMAAPTADWESDDLYMWGFSGGRRLIMRYDRTGKIVARSDSVSRPDEALVNGTFHDDRLVLWKQRSGPVDAHESTTKSTLLEILSPDLLPAGKVETTDRNMELRIVTANGWGAFQSGFMSDNGKSLLVHETLSDTVSYCNPDMTLSTAYTLHLGRYFPPAELFGEGATKTWSTDYGYVGSMWESDEYVIVRINHNPGYEYLVFERSNIPGGFSAVGPDGKPGIFIGGIAFTPMYVRDNRLVGYMQAIDIVDNAASITNPDLKLLAATLKEDSNPVIVVAKLKN